MRLTKNIYYFYTYSLMRVDSIPPEELSIIRIMRKIFQKENKDDKLPGVDMTFDEALDNLRLERERRKLKIKQLESELEKRSVSKKEKNQLIKMKSEHDEWKNMIENTLEELE